MTRSTSRSAARLAAVQALYQQEMEGTPTTRLIHEFHAHRLGATIEDVTYVDAEESFFDDLVNGTAARKDEIDELITARLAEGWSLARLDKPMKALLPLQLEGIGEVGDDVEVVPLKGVGHFAPWQAPDRVAAALEPFLAASEAATGARP